MLDTYLTTNSSPQKSPFRLAAFGKSSTPRTSMSPSGVSFSITYADIPGNAEGIPLWKCMKFGLEIYWMIPDYCVPVVNFWGYIPWVPAGRKIKTSTLVGEVK